jgi:ABC-type multidrug transport system ATPase subunit
MNVIEVQNLTKQFNGKTVLNDLSFEVKEGDVFLIIRLSFLIFLRR